MSLGCANPNAVYDMRPLHLAVAAGQLRCAQVLLAAGADPTLCAAYVLQPDEDEDSARLVRLGAGAGTLLGIAQELRPDDEDLLKFFKSLPQPRPEAAGQAAEDAGRAKVAAEGRQRRRSSLSGGIQRASEIQALFRQATATVFSVASGYPPFFAAPPPGAGFFGPAPPPLAPVVHSTSTGSTYNSSYGRHCAG